MSKPKLLLITKDKLTYSVFVAQLLEYFGDLIEILDYNQYPYSADIDLVLASSTRIIAEDVPGDKILYAKRLVDIAKLEQLLNIPDDSRCLVVNNLLEKTLESIEQLKTLGFKFEMIPCCSELSDQNFDGIDIAINFVSEELVPDQIKHVIEIGSRPMDISTIIQLAMLLNLEIDTTYVSARYIQRNITLSKHLVDTVNNLDYINKQLDGILNTVHDGIISSDSTGNIIQINSAARSILEIYRPEHELIGLPLEEILPNIPDLIGENQVYVINDKHLVINQNTIANKQTAMVTAFQDVTKIQKLEQTLRKSIQQKGLSARYTHKDIIGSSAIIRSAVDKLKKIAQTDQTVVILGESGTGKEIFAHSIHNLSSRCQGPFLPVNFAGLPESLAESELFGYEEGSFTGAKRGGKQGLFELAHNGTIFLDEIGDAPQGLQAMLLRVLQEKVVMRVGGHHMIPIDVRILAATNKNLPLLVQKGTFREDLYYRLFVLPIRIPPLRERVEDILILFAHFLELNTTCPVQVDPAVYEVLTAYAWPGNVRELRSVVQYLVSVMDDKRITFNDLPEQFHQTAPEDSILSLLNQVGNLEDFYVVLSALFKAKRERQNIGRGKIVDFSHKQNYPLTDQQVRLRMEYLHKFNLITIGTRGQGSQITPAGEETLTKLREDVNI